MIDLVTVAEVLTCTEIYIVVHFIMSHVLC